MTIYGPTVKSLHPPLSCLTIKGDIKSPSLNISSLTHLSLSKIHRNSKIILPPSLKYLRLFDCSIPIPSLPPSLTQLHIVASGYCDPPPLPPSLTHVTIFSVSKKLMFPPTTTHLLLASAVPLSFRRVLPSSLSHLWIHHFTFPIDCFPPNLKFLCIDKLDIPFHLLPSTLETLIICNTKFNAPITNLPHCLTFLQLSISFNQPLDLPSSLTHLILSGRFNHPLGQLPANLTHLILYYMLDFNFQLHNLPGSLLHFVFLAPKYTYNLDNLPPLLEYCDINIDNHCNIVLPPAVTHLAFNDSNPSTVLPPLLTHFSCGYYFNRPIDEFPSTITCIIFGFYFNQPLHNLPSTVTHLSFSIYFDQSLDFLPPLPLTSILEFHSQLTSISQ